MSALLLNLPSETQIWSWLDEVPDPEIPVISVVDLGIIRNVAWEEDVLCVDICLLYTSPSPRDGLLSRMPSSA